MISDSVTLKTAENTARNNLYFNKILNNKDSYFTVFFVQP